MAANLGEKFRETALKDPGRIAIQSKKDGKWTEISYSELNDKIESLAASLLEQGIKKGDRVAIILENGPNWPVIFFATVSIGAIVVPINPEASHEAIENILKDSGCKITFRADSDRFKKGLKKDFQKFIIKPHDTVCILYTSGTTDEPKGVVLSHGNLLSNAASLRKSNIITERDNIVSILPLHHAYSLTVTMLLPLLFGGRIVYPGSIKGEAIVEAMQEVNPTVFVAVPRIFYLFHQKITEKLAKIPFPLNVLIKVIAELLYKFRNKTGINAARYLFCSVQRKFGKSLRIFATGGARLDENVAKDFFKFGFTILEGYGLTETSPVLTFNPFKKPKIGSVGVPVPSVEINILNKNKEGAGEVIARGPNIMEGYYKRPDLTADVIKNGWFHTGDMGYIDGEGYLFLTGRLKDMIVLSSGLNIYPQDVEEAYCKTPPVKEMCVLEVPSKRGTKEIQILWAVVVPDLEYFRKNNEMNLREVIKWNIENISKELPAYKRIMGFTVTLDNLPRTLLGKIKRYAVREHYLPKIVEEGPFKRPRELTGDDKKLMEKDVSRKIVNYLKKETKVKNISPQDTLELDLGIDSLKRIELASGFEKVFDIEIKDEAVWRAFTVRDLIEAMESCLAEEKKETLFSEEEKPFSSDEWNKILRIPPKEENIKRIDLNPGFGARILNFVFDSTFGLITKIYCRPKVEGLENLPRKGPYILFVNHTSYFDGFLVGGPLSAQARLDLFFIGFKAYFDVPVVHRLVKTARLIPLNFSTHFLEALRSSYYVLKNGKNLCIFPEGARSFGGKILVFKKGFGILAKESGAKLVPVFIDEAFKAWPRTSAFPRPHPVTVKFGKPLDPDRLEKEGLEMGAEDSYAAICMAARKALIGIAQSPKSR